MSCFKFLQRGGIGPLTGTVWKKGEWVEATGPLVVCASGVHVLRPRDLAHWLHEELWRVEMDGESIEGGDCLVVRRARTTERVDDWSGAGGMRFAQSCHDRIGERLAGETDPKVREHLANYQWAVNWHIERENRAMAGYVSALGIAQVTPEGTPQECFRSERAWQSAWLVRELV